MSLWDRIRNGGRGNRLSTSNAADLSESVGYYEYRLGKGMGIIDSLVEQAQILHSRGDLDGAMALLTEAEKTCHQRTISSPQWCRP